MYTFFGGFFLLSQLILLFVCLFHVLSCFVCLDYIVLGLSKSDHASHTFVGAVGILFHTICLHATHTLRVQNAGRGLL